MYSNFNQDISKWDVSHVKYMSNMFTNSSFNHDISGWDVSNVEEYFEIFKDCNIRNKFKPKKFR